MSDRLAGLIIFAFSVWYGYTAQGFEHGTIDPLGPKIFPSILSVLLGLLGLFLVARPDPEPEWVLGRPLVKQVGTIGTMVAYAFVVQPLGFIWATFFCSAILAWMLGAGPLRLVLTGLGLSFGFFILFDRIFELPLPSGFTGEVLTRWMF